MRYAYTIFWHKNMLNFRLNKFHQRATAHISQAQCAWKCKRDTIIYLYLTTLTFTETRLLIWWVKLLNFLLFPVVFLKWTLPRTLHWFVNFVPRDSLPKLFAQISADFGWQGQTIMGVVYPHPEKSIVTPCYLWQCIHRQCLKRNSNRYRSQDPFAADEPLFVWFRSEYHGLYTYHRFPFPSI